MKKISSLLFLLTILFLTSCATKKPIKTYTLRTPPTIGVTLKNEPLYLGGFSGLYFEEKENNEFIFYAVTNHGPVENNLFYLPEFNPAIVKFTTDSKTDSLIMSEKINLKNSKNKELNGLFNKRDDIQNPVDQFNLICPISSDGINPVGLTRLTEGEFVMGENNAPSILLFSKEGKLKRRFMPGNDLPKIYLEKNSLNYVSAFNKNNSHLLMAFEHSFKDEAKNQVHLLDFDLETYKTAADYFYPINDSQSKLLGLLTLPSNTLLGLEQNSDHSFSLYQLTIGQDESIHKKLNEHFQLQKNLNHLSFALIDSQHLAFINTSGIGEPTELSILELEHKLW